MEKGLEILDGSSPDCAQMDKNRAEYRKWLAGKRNARYGERQAVELTGANGGPVEMITECDEDRIASVMDRASAERGRKKRMAERCDDIVSRCRLRLAGVAVAVLGRAGPLRLADQHL